jgi:hypothetical protein
VTSWETIVESKIAVSSIEEIPSVSPMPDNEFVALMFEFEIKAY